MIFSKECKYKGCSTMIPNYDDYCNHHYIESIYEEIKKDGYQPKKMPKSLYDEQSESIV